MASSRQRVFLEAVPMVALTATICVLDVLTSLAWAVWLLYFIPLALVLHRSPNPVPYQFAALATFLTMLGGYLSPPDIHPDVALINRCLGMAVMWGFTWYAVKQKPVRASLVTETARSHAAPAATVAGRLKVEEQLLISRLRLESIIESAMDAIITVDEDQKIVLFNHAAEQMFGCSAQEAIGQPLDRFLPERFRDAHRHHIHTFGQSGVTSRKMGELGTVMGLRSNDEEFPIEAAISHIALDGKKYYTVILRDISERKRAEESRRESQRQLTTLIGNLPGFVYRCRNDGGWIFEYLSEGVSDLTGYTVEEYLVQRTISYGDNIHPGDGERVRHEIQAALEQHRPFELTYRSLTKSGEVKWAWERGEGIYAQDGTLSYLEGFVTDVTERKRAEGLLRQSEERYRRLIAVSPYAILVSREDRIIFANDQAIKLFGAVKAEEVLEQSPMDLFHVDDHDLVQERIHELCEGRAQGPMLEGTIVTLDGKAVDVEVSGARFVDEEGPAILIMLRDASERKRLQEQLRRTERVAELGTLASGMAHEIGTPMNVILGRAEYLMDRVTEEPIKRGLRTIITQVERITRVMNQLLSFARRKAPQRVPLDLRNVIEDGMEMFQERLARSQIRVEMGMADPCPMVLADADQMSQVLLNLIMNALHAMPDGGTLRVGLEPEQPMVKLTIADTGHGIPPEVIRKIYDPFFTTKEFGKGTGLGLTVVKGIIEEHQGSIAVESEQGKGTRFTILLPRSEELMADGV